MTRWLDGPIARWLLLCALVASSAPAADTLVTLAGPAEGRVELKGGKLLAGGREVPWDEVLLLVRDAPLVVSAPRMLRFKSGEVWAVEVGGVAGGKLKVEGPVCGAQALDQKLLAALDFLRGLPPLWGGAGFQPATQEAGKMPALHCPKTLYRAFGEPLPGEIIWLDRERIGLNSPLGAFSLPLYAARRYVFDGGAPDRSAGPTAPDEVGLTDGSILRGRAQLVDARLELQHAILGTVSLPWDVLRYAARGAQQRNVPPGATFLGWPAAVESRPLLMEPAPPQALDCQETGGDAPDRSVGPTPPEWFVGRCVHGLEVPPATALSWSLPQGRKACLRGWRGCPSGARGAVKVRITVDGKVLQEQVIVPRPAPEWFACELPAGKQVRCDVDLGPGAQLPSALVLADLHLVVGK